MIDFIKKANEEYTNNGRSDRFIRMEDKVIDKGNWIQIYYFARFVRGVDIEKFQTLMLEKAPYDIAFYFIKHVKGVDAKPFILKAGRAGEVFWARKYAEASNTQRQYDAIGELSKLKIDDVEVEFKTGLGNLEMMIFNANNAYSLHNSRDEEFMAIQNEIVYNNINGDKHIFAREVEGADISLFERDAVLTADPLNIFLLASEVKRSNKLLLLKGLELAKLDYVRVDEDLAKRRVNISKIERDIEECSDPWRCKMLEQKLKSTMNNLTYIESANEYEHRIREIIMEQRR